MNLKIGPYRHDQQLTKIFKLLEFVFICLQGLHLKIVILPNVPIATSVFYIRA